MLWVPPGAKRLMFPSMRTSQASETLRPLIDPDEGDEALDPYRTLFMRSADANLIIDGDRFVDCNDAAVKMLRYARKAEVLRSHPSELSPPAQPDGRPSYEKANEMIAIAFEHGSHRFEWDHRRADGEVFPVEVLLTAIPMGDRKILHVVWRDITERKQLEEQLRHAQKMEAIGKLAGGIAHDFNNLLMAIIGNCDLLELQLGPKSALSAHVEQIRKAGSRAADLTRGLLAFSRKQVMRIQVLDLNAVVRDLESLLARLIGEDVVLTADIAPEALPIRADRGQLEQVAINLVTNARDAMPRGGRLRLETRLVDLEENTIGLETDLSAGTYALLAVSDNGVGMDATTARRAFEPFFTTKAVGKGTGLGLSTVYGIVKQSGAEIAIYSVPGRGTTVKVYFPLTEGVVEATRPRSTEPPADGGNETILVAEDEPMVADVVATALRRAGYAVHVARDGAEAFELYRALGHVDLLLSDVVMPNLNGPELVTKLAEHGHRPRVLLASGYATKALAEVPWMGGEIEIVEKPFSTQALLRRVRRVLDR